MYQAVRTLLGQNVEPVAILSAMLAITDVDEPGDPSPLTTRSVGRKALADALAGKAATPPV
jgi:hypothetical protein